MRMTTISIGFLVLHLSVPMHHDTAEYTAAGPAKIDCDGHCMRRQNAFTVCSKLISKMRGNPDA